MQPGLIELSQRWMQQAQIIELSAPRSYYWLLPLAVPSTAAPAPAWPPATCAPRAPTPCGTCWPAPVSSGRGRAAGSPPGVAGREGSGR